MVTHTFYHKCLRVLILFFTTALIFQGNGTSFSRVGTYLEARMLIANVISMSASVTPNEFNVITAELTKRSTELDQREAALKEREINARAFGDTASLDVSQYLLSAVLLLLLVLITMNYVFDYIRMRKTPVYATNS